MILLIVRFQHVIIEIIITYQTPHLKKWKLSFFKNLVQASRNENIWKRICPRALKIEPATGMKIITKIVAYLHQISKGFVTSIFQGDKINEISGQKQRLWIEIVNRFFEETVKIKKINLEDSLSLSQKIWKSNMRRQRKADQKNLSTCKPKTKEAT